MDFWPRFLSLLRQTLRHTPDLLGGAVDQPRRSDRLRRGKAPKRFAFRLKAAGEPLSVSRRSTMLVMVHLCPAVPIEVAANPRDIRGAARLETARRARSGRYLPSRNLATCAIKAPLAKIWQQLPSQKRLRRPKGTSPASLFATVRLRLRLRLSPKAAPAEAFARVMMANCTG